MDQETLKKQFHYDPATGIFTRISGRYSILNGKPSGTKRPDGYLQVSIHNKRYFLHRLAWLYVQGEWPPEQIDHLNGNRADNRLCNLRPASARQNTANRRRAKGVYKQKNRWQASCGGIHIGSFKTEHDARAAYIFAAKERYGEFGYRD